MKKIASILFLIICVQLASGQITLENSYAYSTSVKQVSANEYLYYLMDVPLSQCRLYSASHELMKTIDLSIPEGYYLSDIKYVSRNLFNTDDLIELLYIYEKYVSTDTWYYYQYELAVVNENGFLLLTLPNGAWAENFDVDGENKLLTYQYIYNLEGYYNVTTNIYSLGGELDLSNYSKIESVSIFPNPASEKINIVTSDMPNFSSTKFQMYNISGEMVYSTPLYKDQNLSFTVGQYPSGTYIYNITDKDNKVLKTSKIIIQ